MSLRSSLPLLLLCSLLVSCFLRGQPAPDADGAEIYAVSQCARCHGDDLRGNEEAPTLHGLAAHWTMDRLAGFIAQPNSEMDEDPRLHAMDQQYSKDMLAYENLSQAQRERLATWLLEFE